MKWIKIKNTGLIEPQALSLIGASTKQNDSSKIGQFGSGNKYALAYLLRNNYDVRIYSGLNEIKITTAKETFREIDFDVIFINGEKTSITISMGKDWEFWQAIREIYCNAIDEGGSEIDMVQNIVPVENETHFYIDTSKDVMEFFGNFNNYFAINKKVLFECSEGRILEKTGNECNIYRKGIRCYNASKTSVYDYDFNNITVDEDRLVKYWWNLEEKLWNIIYQCDNEEIINQILHNCGDNNYFEGCISDIATINSSQISDKFKEVLCKTNLAPKGMAGLLKPDEINNHIILPTKIFQSVRGVIGDDNVGDKFKVCKAGFIYREIDITTLYEATLKQVKYFLNECKFNIPYEIKVAIFDEKKCMGTVNEDTIIISNVCMEKGVNEVINTVIEEYIHIKYKAQDETRDFQTAIITEFVSYMKNINAFVV